MKEYLNQEEVKATRDTTQKERKGNPSYKQYRQSNVSRLYRKKPTDLEPQKPTDKNSPGLPRDFKNRFYSQGHWRKIKGIGHDPDGNLVQGYTWVRESLKGPKDKPIKNKIRIVKNSLPPGYKQA